MKLHLATKTETFRLYSVGNYEVRVFYNYTSSRLRVREHCNVSINTTLAENVKPVLPAEIYTNYSDDGKAVPTGVNVTITGRVSLPPEKFAKLIGHYEEALEVARAITEWIQREGYWEED